MHELGIMEDILTIVLRHAAANNISRVISITLEVGIMSDLVEEMMQTYFRYVCEGTIADGAFLKIERVPAVLTCLECDLVFNVEKDQLREPIICPHCGSAQYHVLSGRNYFIKDMEAVS